MSPTEYDMPEKCAYCGVVRSADWMAKERGRWYCLPNGTTRLEDHRPSRRAVAHEGQGSGR